MSSTGLRDATGALNDLVSFGNGLFGSSDQVNTNTTQTQDITQTLTKNNKSVEQLVLSPEAIQGLIRDTLGGANGLAAIFSGEQSSGLYNSSVAAQAAGELSARLIAEIAKITGKKTTTDTGDQTQTQTGTISTQTGTENSNKGLLGNIGDFFGF